MRTRTATAIAAGCLTLALVASASAQAPIANPFPERIPKSSIAIELKPVATGLGAPNTLTHAGDGTNRQFVTDQIGRIRVIENGQLLPEPFLGHQRPSPSVVPTQRERRARAAGIGLPPRVQ